MTYIEPLITGHVSDIHFTERLQLGGKLVLDPATGLNVRLSDVTAGMNAFTEAAAARKVEVTIIAGDVFDVCKPSPNEERAAIDAIERLHRRTQAPVIVIDGNHDYNGGLGEATSLTCLRGRTGVYVAEEPGFFDYYRPNAGSLFDVGKSLIFWRLCDYDALPVGTPTGARIFVLPWPSRSALLADEANRGLTPAEVTQRVSRQLALIVEALRLRRVPGVPNILVFHGTIAEAEVNEQPADIERDIGLRASDLAGFDVVMLGHIHKRQRIAVDSYQGAQTVAWYSGSIDRANVGEEREEKGGNIYVTAPVGDHFFTSTTFVPTPARPYRTISAEDVLKGLVVEDDGRTVFRVQGKVPQDLAGELATRLDAMKLRHLQRDVRIVRARRVRDTSIADLTEDAMVRRRLDARSIPAADQPHYLTIHARLATAGR